MTETDERVLYGHLTRTYYEFGNSREGFIFAKLCICEVFVKINPSRICEVSRK